MNEYASAISSTFRSSRVYKGCVSLVSCFLFLASGASNAQSDAELDILLARLDAVGTRIERQQDLIEVENLQRTYGYYVDKSLWYSLADLWTEDGTLEIGGRGVFLGKDRVFEYMNVGLGSVGPKPGLLVDHQQFQVLATIHPDGKTASVRAIAFVMSNGGWGHNYYEDKFVKEDGVWKFQALHGPFNMYSGYQIGWLDDTVLNTFPEKFKPPPDLPPTIIYLTYPNYYVEPFHYPNPVTGEPMPPHDPAAGGAAFGKYDPATHTVRE